MSSGAGYDAVVDVDDEVMHTNPGRQVAPKSTAF